MHILALISNMMSKCLNLDSLKCSLISVILLCVQFGVVDYDPGTHDQKTKSLHFFEDNKITKIVEFFGKTSYNVSQNFKLITKCCLHSKSGYNSNKSYC